jgi:F-type H+-transporting ATPase subunit b
MPTTTVASNYFIIPNATFFVELFIFFVMFGVLAIWVVPPVTRAVNARRELLRKRAEEAQEAREKMAAAEADYRKALAEARHSASRLREQARESGAAILAEARDAAHEEARGIVDQAHQQIEAERRQAFESLRGDVGSAAVELAGRIVGEATTDDAQRAQIIDEFLSEIGDGTEDVKMVRVS